MQIIRRHQQLQTQLPWQLHIRHILLSSELQIIIQIFAHFLQHNTVDGAECAAALEGFCESAYTRGIQLALKIRIPVKER